MSISPEKFVAAGKASLETSLQAASAASASLFSAVERLSSLNLAAARALFDDSVALSKSVAEAKDPKSLASLQLGLITPVLEKNVAYLGNVASIAAQAQGELSKLYETEAAQLVKNLNAAVEDFAKNAPAGSETAIGALKSAIANATAAYEGATKAAKQVSEVAQANVESATAAAVETVAKTTQAAASVLKSV
ncbi:TIGR01841 family phasin [Thauera sinica]|uniref:TIGR01841 family phasin n=1 Tax=Thauera sinica TaxID=2665146 RepID=A0ABW1AQX5_9RHOO|nr:TIGR01841 family phasin [Thauera sp. K11]ATE61542.1 phasin family protein [Thauera sp. K11]